MAPPSRPSRPPRPHGPRRPRSRPAPKDADPRTAELRDAQRGPRLQKALANAGVASRRDAETLIAQHRVSVNGITVDFTPCFVDPVRDRIEVDGRPLARPRASRTGEAVRSHTYLLVNKPRGVICTSDDPEGRRKILDLVPHDQRLFCVGRLDAESTGLVLLTDDGELANKLTHPRYGVAKTYLVTVKGSLTEADIDKLEGGIYLADKAGKSVKAAASSVRILSREADRTKVAIRLREGRNREIRRMLARLGYRVHRLQRVGLGPLQLKGVGFGQWRALKREEVAALRHAGRLGEKKLEARGSKPRPRRHRTTR